jgi:hypothetical protein
MQLRLNVSQNEGIQHHVHRIEHVSEKCGQQASLLLDRRIDEPCETPAVASGLDSRQIVSSPLSRGIALESKGAATEFGNPRQISAEKVKSLARSH